MTIALTAIIILDETIFTIRKIFLQSGNYSPVINLKLYFFTFICRSIAVFRIGMILALKIKYRAPNPRCLKYLHLRQRYKLLYHK